MLISFTKYIILFISVVIVYSSNSTKWTYVKTENVRLSDELPRKSDLHTYVQSLKRIVNFCTKHKKYLDLNFIFGLFLLNVNLKHTVAASEGLPEYTLNDFHEIFHRNDKLLAFFKHKTKMILNRNHQRNENDIMIASLFSNEQVWSGRLQKLGAGTSNLKNPNRRGMRGIDLEWQTYRNNVDDFDRWTPNPKQSDMCMASLGSNSNSDIKYHIRCKVPEPCYEMLRNGTDFGYALQHRLLFLLSAHLARGCNIFSPKQDTKLRNNFCAITYFETERIAAHSYDIVDLLIEQICLCSLDGHAQFLRRTWLANILRYQKPHGCFGVHLHGNAEPNYPVARVATEEWEMSKNDQVLLGGLCEGHVTSGAAGTIAAAVRFILEKYY